MLSTDRQQKGHLANPKSVNTHSDYPSTRRRVLIALQAQMALGLVGCSSGGGSTAPASSAPKGSATSIPQRHYSPDHTAYDYSDHFSSDVSEDAAAFTRMIEDGHGLMHVNPGSRIRFATDSARVGISLRYSARISSHVIFNGVGTVLVNGEVWTTFEREWGDAGDIVVPLEFPDAYVRIIEILLPLSAGVEFLGTTLDGQAMLMKPPLRPALRCGIFGDSISQGLGASRSERSWPFLLGRMKQWQIINGGYAGYPCLPETARAYADAHVDVATYMIGANDFVRQIPLDRFRSRFLQWVLTYRALSPATRLYCVTPTHSLIDRPISLEAYRQIIRETISTTSDPLTSVIDGPSLAPGDTHHFPDGLHPGDDGSERIATSLVASLSA